MRVWLTLDPHILTRNEVTQWFLNFLSLTIFDCQGIYEVSKTAT